MSTSLTIESRLLSVILDRLKNIVAGISFRYSTTNKAVTEVFTVVGDYLLDVPAKIEATVTADGATVEFLYEGVITEHDFSITPEFVLFDTGYTLTVNDVNVLYVDDVFDIRCANATETIPFVRTWLDASTNSKHPFIQLYPGDFSYNSKKTTGKTVNECVFDMQLELDMSQSMDINGSINLLELAGDIRDELRRDPRLHEDESDPNTCLAVDSYVVNVVPYTDTSSANLSGIFLSLVVEYRANLNNSRQK